MEQLNIFLDDERKVPSYPYKFNRVFRNGEDLIEYLTTNPGEHYHVISFDHDLGECMNGYEVVKNIVNNNKINFTFDYWLFHTDNPVGRENMICYLNNAIRHNMLDITSGVHSVANNRSRVISNRLITCRGGYENNC